MYTDEDKAQILGFIGLAEDYIAGIFAGERRSRGIGKELLDHAKRGKRKLTLNVYAKHGRRAVLSAGGIPDRGRRR